MTALLACGTRLPIAVPLLVILITSPVPGTVIVPFPSNVAMICVWFIGIMAVVLTVSSQIGWAENSNPNDGVVVLLPVVEADTGLTVVDAKTIASVKIVAAAVVIAGYLLHSKVIFLLLSLIFSVLILYASGIEKTNDKRVESIDKKRHQCSERMI